MSSQEHRSLNPYLTPAGAWAIALGTSIGWGSLVITSSTYLSQAGPLGSTLGMVIGAVIMLIISRNYYYMMNCFPDAGGAYAYARDSYGYDHGFLVAWFMTLTYLAMLWANATALPLFARYFFGTVFEFGKLYTIFGYDVYLGEALLTILAILLICFLCSAHRRTTAFILTVLVCLFTIGILICFAAAFLRLDRPLSPAIVPERKMISQVIHIAVISPWAFIGFESISNATEEFSFRRSNLLRILVISIISTTALYICITLLSVTAYPPEYDSWLAYIRDVGNLGGIKGLPAFYAARHYLGDAGVWILTASLLALVITSLIGNILALSRLFYAMAKDHILPGRISVLNRHDVPGNAIVLIACISLVIPFLGRTAIGWIVDVTTMGATLIYGFVSACTFHIARVRNDRSDQFSGLIGLVVMIGFGLYLLVPNLFSAGSMASVSYFLFVVWAVLGFIYFRIILEKDQMKHFGNSTIVWIALLSLILFVSLVWMNQSIMSAASTSMDHLRSVYSASGITDSGMIEAELTAIRFSSARSAVSVMVLFGIALGILLNNYSLISRRARESEAALGRIRDIANTDPLTGVKSKHAYTDFEEKGDQKISSGEADPFALVVCDVNGLKHVNDTYGHKAGDEYIRSASALICEIFQHSPVFRTGGDEFVVFLKGRDFEARQELMDELHDKSVSHIPSGEVVVAAGLSEYAKASDTAVHQVFERADARMYAEKQRLKDLGSLTR